MRKPHLTPSLPRLPLLFQIADALISRNRHWSEHRHSNRRQSPSPCASVVGARAIIGSSSTVAATGSPTPTARIVVSVPIPPSHEQSKGGEGRGAVVLLHPGKEDQHNTDGTVAHGAGNDSPPTSSSNTVTWPFVLHVHHALAAIHKNNIAAPNLWHPIDTYDRVALAHRG
uniref:Uncharacterized protein n=1 Tax=Oryza meridionalis TaxID=40149 RepID=A0A0E0EPK4_9ORYZ